MMVTAKRFGARMSVSIGVALLVMATVAPVSSAAEAPRRNPCEALILCGTTARRPTTTLSSRQEPVHRADSSGPGSSTSR